MDTGDVYIGTPLDRYEYMQMPIKLFSQHTIDQYSMMDKLYKGYVYLEIRKAIYGLLQTGILANKQLQRKLMPS